MKNKLFRFQTMWKLLSLLLPLTAMPGCKNPGEIAAVQQWTTYEITLISEMPYSNAYSEIDVWAQFTNDKEDTILKPAFWDGGNTWKIRFAPPD